MTEEEKRNFVQGLFIISAAGLLGYIAGRSIGYSKGYDDGLTFLVKCSQKLQRS